MFECHVQCFPWDIVDEGINSVLDALQGQIGATGLTLVAVADEAEQFRPHTGVNPQIYRTSGGVYFQPKQEFYQATRIKPPAWDQHRRLDTIAQVSEACVDRDFGMRISLSPLNSHRIASRHKDAACKNVFGVSSRCALCVHNEDVRQYVVSLANDLAEYDDLAGVVLEDVQWPSATDWQPRMEAIVLFGTNVSILLDLCFCESSLRSAAKNGVDGVAALRCTQAVMDKCYRDGGIPDNYDVLAEYSAIAQYVAYQDQIMISLVREIKQSLGKPLICSLKNSNSGLVHLPTANDIITLSDGLVCDANDIEEVIVCLSEGTDLGGALSPSTVGSMELLLPIDEGSVDSGAEAVRQITWAAEAGASGVTVTHYGLLLQSQFDWVHQGVRNARRLLA